MTCQPCLNKAIKQEKKTSHSHSYLCNSLAYTSYTNYVHTKADTQMFKISNRWWPGRVPPLMRLSGPVSVLCLTQLRLEGFAMANTSLIFPLKSSFPKEINPKKKEQAKPESTFKPVPRCHHAFNQPTSTHTHPPPTVSFQKQSQVELCLFLPGL